MDATPMTQRSRSRRRLLQAYARGIRDARAVMQKSLDEMRVSLEHELMILRGEVRQLQVERSRAQEICRVLEIEHEPG
jgi:hypothetical protein